MSGPTPRPGILDIPLYVPGTHAAGGDIEPAILSANENPLGASGEAVDAVRKSAESLHRYPEGGSIELRRAIAGEIGCAPENLICGSGSDEIISMLIRAYAGPGDEVLQSRHGFLMYAISAKTVGATPVFAPETNLTTDVDNMLAHVTDRTRLVFVANPNNPTGSYISGAELARLHAGLPEDVILVIDAAYSEYVEDPDYSDGQELVAAHENVVMTRTFSKIFGLAALRLGWAYAPSSIIDVVNRVRGPFNVGAPAQAAGLAAWADKAHIAESRRHNKEQIARVSGALDQLGITVPSSVGNFILAGFGSSEKAEAALDYLMAQGVIPRSVAGYGLPEYLRITIGTVEENSRLISALTDFSES